MPELYAFTPQWQYGPDSFFVCANSKEEAEAAVIKAIEERGYNQGHRDHFPSKYDCKVLEMGEVTMNPNE